MTEKLVKLKKIDHDHAKYITNQEFSKSTAETFTARCKQSNLTFRRKDRFL